MLSMAQAVATRVPCRGERRGAKEAPAVTTGGQPTRASVSASAEPRPLFGDGYRLTDRRPDTTGQHPAVVSLVRHRHIVIDAALVAARHCLDR